MLFVLGGCTCASKEAEPRARLEPQTNVIRFKVVEFITPHNVRQYLNQPGQQQARARQGAFSEEGSDDSSSYGVPPARPQAQEEQREPRARLDPGRQVTVAGRINAAVMSPTGRVDSLMVVNEGTNQIIEVENPDLRSKLANNIGRNVQLRGTITGSDMETSFMRVDSYKLLS